MITTICIAEIFFKALEVFNTSVAATEYPPIDEKFLIDIILDYPRGYLCFNFSSCKSTSKT